MTLKERFESLQRYERDCDELVQDPDGNLLDRRDVLALASQLDRKNADAAAFGLACLSPEARLEAMAPWCSHCGGEKPCNCMRDD